MDSASEKATKASCVISQMIARMKPFYDAEVCQGVLNAVVEVVCPLQKECVQLRVTT